MLLLSERAHQHTQGIFCMRVLDYDNASASTMALPTAVAEAGFWPVKMRPSLCTWLLQLSAAMKVAPRAERTWTKVRTNVRRVCV